ncbi:MAG: cupredoxin family protein [Ottowia sp.]|uniref:cupredoxin domain-containing protein n=1 Tax=unclassified Ottowia TaxID=2645081 RepID=UPI003C2AC7AE
MQPTKSVIRLFLATTVLASSAAMAAGNHAGGHGHGGDETAIGKPGIAAKANRTVNIVMNDNMRYAPSDIQVKQGETVRFVVKNAGQIKHELSLGTEKELLEHLEQMKKFPDMEHDEPGKITLQPGKEGEIVWQFTKAGAVNFACLIPGHYEAGMKGQVRVTRQ